MKIKVLPEDFVVKEEIDIKIKPKGEYRIYLLTKKHWNTMDAIKAIAKENRIPIEKIGICGRKDRHAITYQYLSVPNGYEIYFDKENVKINFIGFSDDFVSTSILKGNYFEITIRKIKDEYDNIKRRLQNVINFGFPNYFDDQRFGSVEDEEQFIGEKIVKGHYNGALKLYFTTVHPEDKKEEKERKRRIEALWGRFSDILPYCKTKTEKQIIKCLMRGKSRHYLIEAVNMIPKDELSMFFSAYQAYIWNKTLSNILFHYTDLLKPVKGKIMDYLFYENICEEKIDELKNIQIPTVSAKIPSVSRLVDNTIIEILDQRGVETSDFELRHIKKSFYKSFLRHAMVFPKDLWYSELEKDEFYDGYYKLRLSFRLPAGSFATMLIKSLTVK